MIARKRGIHVWQEFQVYIIRKDRGTFQSDVSSVNLNFRFRARMRVCRVWPRCVIAGGAGTIQKVC